MLVHIYQITRHNIPKENNLETSKSHITSITSYLATFRDSTSTM